MSVILAIRIFTKLMRDHTEIMKQAEDENRNIASFGVTSDI
jgi:hypothetical protein